MPANAAAENALGTIGAVCWTIQLIPQIWKSYHDKSTDGLSPWLVLLWGISGAFLGVYVIVQDLNIPLIIQPQLFATLSLVSWAQCQYYDRKRTLSTCILAFLSLFLVLGGFEAGMIFAIRPAYHAGNIRPVQFFGIFSSVIISLALFPQYYEIYKHREVIGISVIFMLIDLLGGVFSDLSLAFKEEFDVIAAVTYSLVVVLDGIVILLALILNPMAKRRRQREAELALPAIMTQDPNAPPLTTIPSSPSSSPTRNSISGLTTEVRIAGLGDLNDEEKQMNGDGDISVHVDDKEDKKEREKKELAGSSNPALGTAAATATEFRQRHSTSVSHA